MNFEVIYTTNKGSEKCYFKNIEDITKAFGLTEREITSYYTSVSGNVNTFESVVNSIKRVEGGNYSSAKKVVFD